MYFKRLKGFYFIFFHSCVLVKDYCLQYAAAAVGHPSVVVAHSYPQCVPAAQSVAQTLLHAQYALMLNVAKEVM